MDGCDPNGGGGIGANRGSRVCCWDCGREKGWLGGRGSISFTDSSRDQSGIWEDGNDIDLDFPSSYLLLPKTDVLLGDINR